MLLSQVQRESRRDGHIHPSVTFSHTGNTAEDGMRDARDKRGCIFPVQKVVNMVKSGQKMQ